MVDLSKDLNSKRFLFTYLIIVGFLLVLISFGARRKRKGSAKKIEKKPSQ